MASSAKKWGKKLPTVLGLPSLPMSQFMHRAVCGCDAKGEGG